MKIFVSFTKAFILRREEELKTHRIPNNTNNEAINENDGSHDRVNRRDARNLPVVPK